MHEKNLRDELEAATKIRKAHGSRRAKILAMILDQKKKLRQTKEYKDLKHLKAELIIAEKDHARACETVFGINDEILTGQTRLPLFDSARANGQPAAEPDSAREPVPVRRGPGRPRKQQEGATA